MRQAAHFIPVDYADAAYETAASQREPLIGQYVGDYLIVERLGKGGFGKVLLGLQRPLFRLRAAIKILDVAHENAVLGQRIVEKFENEAASLAVLQHPNVVRLLQYGSFQDQPFLAMEFVPGARTLHDEINRAALNHSSIAPNVVRHVLLQILNALEAAHDQYIIHRDIKPDNIMLQAVVGDPWHVKVVDFGLAKVVVESRDTSVVLGTAVYMAPEQLKGTNLGPWTDIYAIAAVAFELMTGRRAFAGNDTKETLRKKLTASYDPFVQLEGARISPLVVDFLRKGLAHHPEDRFRSTTEMRDALIRLFELGPLTDEFSQDLSSLLNSEEISQLRREEERLEAKRQVLVEERRRLEAERRRAAETSKPQHADRASLANLPTVAPETAPHGRRAWTLSVQTPAIPTEPPANTYIRRQLPSSAPQSRDSAANLESTGIPKVPSRVQRTVVDIEDAPRRGRVTRWVWGGGALLAGVFMAVISSPGDTPEVVEVVSRADVPAPSEQVTPTASSEAPLPDIVDVVPDVTNTNVPQEDAAPVPQMVTVRIESRPAGAVLTVDDLEYGRTPVELATVIGVAHRLELRLAGYSRETRELLVESSPEPLLVVFKPLAKPSNRPAAQALSKPPDPPKVEPAKSTKPKLAPIFIDE